METLETISKRASLKSFLSAREVEQEKITKILDAARLAPSARNAQPWRFIVVMGKENVENVVTKAFFGFNQIAKEAPVLIIACANPNDDDIHEGREYYLFDVGLAVENILLAATPPPYQPILLASLSLAHVSFDFSPWTISCFIPFLQSWLNHLHPNSTMELLRHRHQLYPQSHSVL